MGDRQLLPKEECDDLGILLKRRLQMVNQRKKRNIIISFSFKLIDDFACLYFYMVSKNSEVFFLRYAKVYFSQGTPFS